MTEIPETIPHDGTTDVTDDLNAWLNNPANWPDGAIELPLYGAYGHSGPIEMVGQHGFRIFGRGCQFRDLTEVSGRSDSHLAFTRCDDWSIRSVLISGTAPVDANPAYVASYEAQHGFDIRTCRRWRIDNCYVDGVWGDKVCVATAGPYEPWSEDGEITGLRGGYSHRSGLVITGGRRIRTSGNDWGRVSRTGIDLEPNSARGGCVDLQSVGDRWGYHRLYWVSSNAGSATRPGGPCTQIKIQDAVVEGGNIKVWTAGNHPLADWTIDNCQGDQGDGNQAGCIMQFRNMHGQLVITNNRNPMNRGRTPPMRIARWEAADGTSWGSDAEVTYDGNSPDDG